jgi:CheY-like chemotaxis protein
MNDDRQPACEVPPEDFVRQVKDVLERLYDFPYLQYHPLVQGSSVAAERSGETAGQRLRSDIVAAIESLSPGPGVPFRAPHARLYNLLHLRYIEGMTVQEAAHELGISERQGYRDLRRGEESVAAVLWTLHSVPLPSVEPGAARLSSIQVEMARLEPKPRPSVINLLLEQAQKIVERLASARSVRFHNELSGEPASILTDPVLALQVFTNLFSYAVQQAQPGDLNTELHAGPEGASLTLRYIPEAHSRKATFVNQVVTELIERLHWKVHQEDQADGSRAVVLAMMARGPTVLVIDDNEGLVELLDRYLTGHACRVLPASSGPEGLKLAKQVSPDAIVLDVMMPEMDGWELLQRLRAHSQTATMPVIVCSVFNDPELAYSLGASLFVPKPVKRAEILAALRQLGVV